MNLEMYIFSKTLLKMICKLQSNYPQFFHLCFEGVTMGKPYGKELENLERTYQWALEAPIENICSFVNSSKNKPLITVGSGGSFTVASMISLLHQEGGAISKAVTPLSLIPLKYSIKNSSVLILSAGGRNSDILSAFRFAACLEPAQVLGICLRPQSPLGKLASKFDYTDVVEYEPPIKKDGFLATNSILALLILFIRAYNKVNPECNILSLEFTYTDGIDDYLNTFAKPLLKKDTWITLYGGWGLPAAIDAESKFTESSLKNIQICDYRNFAHGRHYWLHKRTNQTGIIALITPQEKEIAEKTLSIVPKEIPVLRLNTNFLGSIGSLELILKILFLVKVVGISEGVDPGMPKVPTFGRKIYHLRPSTNLEYYSEYKGITSQEIRAIKLKSNYQSLNEMKKEEIVFWKKSLQDFIANLESTSFGTVVFDYDGTLCDPREKYIGLKSSVSVELIRLLENGIVLGIATGRGKSVKESLRNVLPEKYWERVLIGYYNGSDISFLNDEIHPDKSKLFDSNLLFLKHLLDNNQQLQNIANFEYRPKQISIEEPNFNSSHIIKDILQDIINKSNLIGVRVLESSHSIDILAPGVSKLTLVDECKKFAKKLGNPETALCIGDKGKWPGNDYELLSVPYSLSVDTVSPDPKSCWNFGELGQRGVQTMLYYMKHLEVSDGSVCLKLSINKDNIKR